MQILDLVKCLLKLLMNKIKIYFSGYHLHLLKVIFVLFFVSTNSYSNSESFNLEGIVLDAENSEPILNAVVFLVGTNLYTTTKSDGTFSLDVNHSGSFRIKITHLAYQEKLIDVNSENELNKKLIVYLIPKAINLPSIIVTDNLSSSVTENLKDYSTILKGKELQKQLSQTLASTLKNESGLSVRSMGPAPSRPVYRGLGQDRIFISEDGMESIDLSSTSPDHAVTIEPFTAEKIEVLRGPKILTKTSSTVGGVINISRGEIPTQVHNRLHLSLGGYAETVNKGYLGAIQSEVPLNPFSLKIEISKRKTSDLSTPEGLLKNSYSDNINASVGSSYISSFGYNGIAYRSYNLNYGIPGGFTGAHPNGVKIDITKKQIHFDSKFNLSDESRYLRLGYKNIYYRHKEFEFSGKIGSEFRIITNLANIDFHHSDFSFSNNGILGLSAEHRDFEIGGFVFTPPTKSLNVSAYLYEEFQFENTNIKVGARYSYDKIIPKFENFNSKIGAIKKRIFSNISLSASIFYQLSERVIIGLNISRSSRVPTIEELFSEGPHLAAYSYEVGNPELKSEKGIGTEFFIFHKFDKLNFNINLFYNNFESFIIPRNSGQINYQTFLPIYQTIGVATIFYGIDGSLTWNFFDNYFLVTSFGYTIGIFRNDSKPLPQIPPLKGRTGVQFKKENFQIGIDLDWAFSQRNVDVFEQPTDGYVIINSFIQYLFSLGESVNSISLSFDNILNKSYRNHLSRIKSILPEAGFNVRVVYKLMI